MKGQPTFLKIRSRIRGVNRLLAEDNLVPRNADRSLWAEFAIVNFASVTGLGNDVEADPETVLADLLADLMHWCRIQKVKGRASGPIDFESALERARNHYSSERNHERS